MDIINKRSALSFEDFKQENGITFWWASDLLVMLGYKDMNSFGRVIDRVTKAFMSLNIPHYENIIPHFKTVGDEDLTDFKLSRFACYLAVMNGDPKKIEVAEAQAYFAQQTRKFELFLQNGNQIDRMLIREELSEGNKALSSVAKEAGVQDFAKFQNAGYLGMYNMPSWKLEKRREVPKGKLMDYMGRAELAANLFRVTQTEERIKSKGVKGQAALESTHNQVGKEVRDMVYKNTGRGPEELPKEQHLLDLKKGMKIGHKNMLNHDKTAKNKKIESKPSIDFGDEKTA